MKPEYFIINPVKRDEQTDQVGIALVSLFSGDATFLTLDLFCGVLKEHLKRHRIVLESEIGGGLGRNFVLATIEVADKRPALACLAQLPAACGLQGLVEIAWFDQAEEVWRSVEPHSLYGFHELMGKVDFEGMRAEAAERVKAIDRCATELRREREDHGD